MADPLATLPAINRCAQAMGLEVQKAGAMAFSILKQGKPVAVRGKTNLSREELRDEIMRRYEAYCDAEDIAINYNHFR